MYNIIMNFELVKENIKLKEKIILYETSSKLDYIKIEKLKDNIKELQKVLNENSISYQGVK